VRLSLLRAARSDEPAVGADSSVDLGPRRGTACSAPWTSPSGNLVSTCDTIACQWAAGTGRVRNRAPPERAAISWGPAPRSPTTAMGHRGQRRRNQHNVSLRAAGASRVARIARRMRPAGTFWTKSKARRYTTRRPLFTFSSADATSAASARVEHAMTIHARPRTSLCAGASGFSLRLSTTRLLKVRRCTSHAASHLSKVSLCKTPGAERLRWSNPTDSAGPSSDAPPNAAAPGANRSTRCRAARRAHVKQV